MRQTFGRNPDHDMRMGDDNFIHHMANTNKAGPFDGPIRDQRERLSRIESLLKTAGILHDGDINSDDPSPDEYESSDEETGEDVEAGEDIFPPSQPGARDESNDPFASSTSSPDAQSFPRSGGVEVAPIFRSHERDDPRYFGKSTYLLPSSMSSCGILVIDEEPGRSCSLSLLSRGGIEWIKSKTGDVSFLKVLTTDTSHDDPWTQWRPDVFHDLFASKVYKPLPPRSEVFSLIKEYFRTGNRLCPIFDEESFMAMVEWQYTQQTCDDAARWASINMVVSLAYEFRFSKSAKPEKDREKARLYFKNAMSVFTELALRRTDLLSVQALAFFLRGDTDPQSVLPFVTAAMRSCQRMGLHRDVPRPDLSPIEREQRRRVFWVAFTIDQSTCLRAGNPPTQHPDDFDVPLPSELNEGRNGTSPTDIPFFRQLCRMSVIKSRIFCQLYSAKALLRSPSEIYQSVHELDLELAAWRKDFPSHENSWQPTSQANPLVGFGTIALDFVYYNALMMTHRIPILLNYLIVDRGHPSEIETVDKARTAKSMIICANASRETLKMVNNMSWGDVAWIWSFLDYVFLAAATIFSTIIRDTRSSQVREDLQSLRMAATFFATLSQPSDGPSQYAEFMSRMSANLERIARGAIEKDEKRARGPEDRDGESVIPGSKRHNHNFSKVIGKNRHRSSRPRPSGKATANGGENPSTHAVNPASSIPTMPTASVATLPTYPRSTGFSIPGALDGLPPVNADGYVVPVSPSPSPSPSLKISTTLPRPQLSQPQGLDYGMNSLAAFAQPTAPETILDATQPIWPVGQENLIYNTTNSPTVDNQQSPLSSNSGTPGTAMFPASWEVPLTADWQFGDDFWSGLFPNETVAASAQTGGGDIPILSAESFFDMPRGGVVSPSGPVEGYTSSQMPYNTYMSSRAGENRGPFT
ncbi:hypothetical protein PDE_05201 [Penicillium oxalicum 114-2]|uniref:Xylanolytic transcriptional activator regulatory domain-containing protein n=1 Tax=Penicillium oxalicum (strain 114-2 / CGMCC 5302) TaxID=933388 RepID=S7ZHW5_PENO1|nr:hypothetical protein PDE_05201 [Penicillium oxalicum 114-2]